MPAPTSITDLSQTADSNFPVGSQPPSVLDNTLRAHASFIALLRDGKGHANATTLASAATTDIGGQNSLVVEVSGTATVTSFGTNYNGPRFIRFTGACTLTHNATTLILPGAANITTAANDSCLVVPKNALDGWAVISYQKADGTAISATSTTDYLNTTRSDVASSATVNLTSSAPNTRHINITGSTAITAFTVAAGQCYFVRFAGAMTLTNNASIVTQTGANIATADGDTCLIRATAANTVEILCFTKFSNAATESQAGIVELATSAETQTGTDATKAVTPDGFSAASLGYEQTWQFPSRSAGTTYQNTTGKPIQVSITWSGGDGGTADLYVDTNSSPANIIARGYQLGASNGGASGKNQLTAIVPNEHYYKCVMSGASVSVWAELR